MRPFVGRALRRKLFYLVPQAGAMKGYGRSESYRRARSGEIPTERHGRLLVVPKKPWDREVKQVKRLLANAR
jgi:hypothetical protein